MASTFCASGLTEVGTGMSRAGRCNIGCSLFVEDRSTSGRWSTARKLKPGSRSAARAGLDRRRDRGGRGVSFDGGPPLTPDAHAAGRRRNRWWSGRIGDAVLGRLSPTRPARGRCANAGGSRRGTVVHERLVAVGADVEQLDVEVRVGGVERGRNGEARMAEEHLVGGERRGVKSPCRLARRPTRWLGRTTVRRRRRARGRHRCVRRADPSRRARASPHRPRPGPRTT